MSASTLQAWLYPQPGFKSLQTANTLCNMHRMHYTAGKQIGYQEFWERMCQIR